MPNPRILVVRPAGARTGKLISDPEVWFAANAQIDGVDPHSTIPADRLTYSVYQRRALIEALRTKALLLAMLNPEKATEAAQKYFAAVLPLGAIEETITTMSNATDKSPAWAALGPLAGKVTAGSAVGASQGLVVSQKPRAT